MSNSQTDTPLAVALRALLAPNQSATDAVQAYKSVAFKELTPSTHAVPDLGFTYSALEPAISGEINILHHSKHHATYVANLNAAEKTLASADPEQAASILSALRFNGGGHLNHSIFWRNLAPNGSPQTKLDESSTLGKQIKTDFGSFDELKKKLNAATAGVQGSGWGWLGYDKTDKKLKVTTTANQDPLLDHVPILGIDIWEHAFYLQYKNVKADYLTAIWTVFNYEEANRRLESAL